MSKHVWEKPGKFPTGKAEAPFTSEYLPEIDFTRELDAIECAYYQSLIVVFRWIVELGRVDIYIEVSIISSCLALPRAGHLEQLYHNTEIVFDPSVPIIND